MSSVESLKDLILLAAFGFFLIVNVLVLAILRSGRRADEAWERALQEEADLRAWDEEMAS